jgi:biotin carboxylase
MPTTVLVTRAGSGGATNLISGLRLGLRGVKVVGCHEDPFTLKKSTADENYLVAPVDDPGYLASLSSVLRRERPDLVIPVTDADTAALARIRYRIPARVFLPESQTLKICGDKLTLARRLRARRVPAPKSYAVGQVAALPAVFARLRAGTPGWCRARRGAGSVAAGPMSAADRARAWIDLWCQARGLTPADFMVAEYLPGRDFASQSLWKNGRLVLIKTTERLAYVDGQSRLSGTSSVASLHKTVCERRLVDLVVRAVVAVAPRATGAFSVDMKEDVHARPCVTEINAGRLLSGTTIFDQVGSHNMSATYVRLALDQPAFIRRVYDSPEGHYVARELDTPPHVFDQSGFWTGWVDARVPTIHNDIPKRKVTSWEHHRRPAQVTPLSLRFRERKETSFSWVF